MFLRFPEAFNTLSAIQTIFDDVSNYDYFGQRPSEDRAYPVVNAYQKDDEIVLTAELPGIKKEDIQIEVNSNQIRLAGKREIKYEDNENPHKRERRDYQFDRSFKLSFNVDPEKIKAELKDGILKIHLERIERDKPKKIEIL